MREIIVQRPWLAVGCTLGEGPLYDPSTSLLHFVDISENKVFHVNIDTLELAVEQFEEPISCLALRQNGAGVSFEAFRIISLTRASS